MVDLKKKIIKFDLEYNALMTQVLKIADFQNTLININFTIVSAIIGFGLGKTDNYHIILIIPPIEVLFSLQAKFNSYYIAKIDFFIKKKYSTESSLLWQHWDSKLSVPVFSFQVLLGIGSYAIYPFVAVISLLLYYIKTNNFPESTFEENIPWIVGGLCLLFVMGIHFIFSTARTNRILAKQAHTALILQSELFDESAD